MIRVYIDDSGKADTSPSLVLAGYLATEPAWKRFSEEWYEMLNQHRILSFHMTDLWSMKRKTGLKSRIAQSQLFFEATQIIKKNLLHAFAISVPFEAHQHWFATNENPQLRVLRTYYWAVNTLFIKICEYSWKNFCNQPLSVVFEEQGDEATKHILEGMDEFRKLAEHHFPGLKIENPMFLPGKNCARLQSADMLAWLVRRDASNAASRVDRRWKAEALMLQEALSVGATVKIWTDTELEKAASQLANDLVKKFSSNPTHVKK